MTWKKLLLSLLLLMDRIGELLGAGTRYLSAKSASHIFPHGTRMHIKDCVFSATEKRTGNFGKLVPYGQVWRTGANEATEITLTKNMQVNGSLLKAGTYAIFTIPKKKNGLL